MIDDRAVQQPIYATHQRFYAWARQFTGPAGGTATAAAFRTAAAAFLEDAP